MPVNASPSSGNWFHCLHATSQALQPMHSVVSVKKPLAMVGQAVPPARPNIASQRLRLLNANIRIRDERDQLVRRITLDQPFTAPVIGHADLVDRAPANP